jgi:DNA primase
VQECGRIMEISERVLFSELAQLLHKNTGENTKTVQQKERTLQVVKEGGDEEQKVDALYLLEKEIIKILLLYGNEKVSFVQFLEVEDESGKTSIEKEEYTNQVSQELYVNLQEDEIEFTNTVFKTVYYELIHQINQEEKIQIDRLVHHENQQIANEVTSILMDEEKYELSNWERKEIYLTDIKKILPKLVSDAILNLRRVLIEKKIEEILKEAKSQNATTVDLELITNYIGLKKRLFEKLNRVV